MTCTKRASEAMMDDKAIAARIEDYTALYDRQIEEAGGWPATFVFPQPASPLEQEAMRRFLDDVETGTGLKLQITYRRP